MQAKVSSRVTEKRPVSSWSSVPRGKNLLQTACSWLLADKSLRRPTNAQPLRATDLPRRTNFLVRRSKSLVRRSKRLVRRSAKLVGGNQHPRPARQILPARALRPGPPHHRFRPAHQIPGSFCQKLAPRNQQMGAPKQNVGPAKQNLGSRYLKHPLRCVRLATKQKNFPQRTVGAGRHHAGSSPFIAFASCWRNSASPRTC